MSDGAEATSNSTEAIDKPVPPMGHPHKRKKLKGPALEADLETVAEVFESAFTQVDFNRKIPAIPTKRWYYDVPAVAAAGARVAGLSYDSHRRKWYIQAERCPGPAIMGFPLSKRHADDV